MNQPLNQPSLEEQLALARAQRKSRENIPKWIAIGLMGLVSLICQKLGIISSASRGTEDDAGNNIVATAPAQNTADNSEAIEVNAARARDIESKMKDVFIKYHPVTLDRIPTEEEVKEQSLAIGALINALVNECGFTEAHAITFATDVERLVHGMMLHKMQNPLSAPAVDEAPSIKPENIQAFNKLTKEEISKVEKLVENVCEALLTKKPRQAIDLASELNKFLHDKGVLPVGVETSIKLAPNGDLSAEYPDFLAPVFLEALGNAVRKNMERASGVTI